MSVTGIAGPSSPSASSSSSLPLAQSPRRSSSSFALSEAPLAQGHLAHTTSAPPRSARALNLGMELSAAHAANSSSEAASSSGAIDEAIPLLDPTEIDAAQPQALTEASMPTGPAHAAPVVRAVSKAVIWASAQALVLHGAYAGFRIGGAGGGIGAYVGVLAAVCGFLLVPRPLFAAERNHINGHSDNAVNNSLVSALTSEIQTYSLKSSVQAGLNQPIKSSDGENRQVQVKACFEAASKIDLNLALKIFNQLENRNAIANLIEGGHAGNQAARKLAERLDPNIAKLYLASSHAFMSKKRSREEIQIILKDQEDFCTHMVGADSEVSAYFGLPQTGSGNDGLQNSSRLANAVDRLNGWLNGEPYQNRGMNNYIKREIKEYPATLAALFLTPETLHIPENATLQEFVQRLASAKPFEIEESSSAAQTQGAVAPGKEAFTTSVFRCTPFETTSVDFMRAQLMALPESVGIPQDLIQSEIDAVFNDAQLVDQLHQLAASTPNAVAALATSDKVNDLYKLMQMMGLRSWTSSSENILAVDEAKAAIALIAKPLREAPHADENKSDFVKHKLAQLRARQDLGLNKTDTISPARHAQLQNLLERASLATVAEATRAIPTTELSLVAGDIFKYPGFMAIPRGADPMDAIKTILQLDFRMMT
jgi:hypothetical protein